MPRRANLPPASFLPGLSIFYWIARRHQESETRLNLVASHCGRTQLDDYNPAGAIGQLGRFGGQGSHRESQGENRNRRIARAGNMTCSRFIDLFLTCRFRLVK
jgi:hypothetical protein